MCVVLFFFFKQKTAYEMRISDWSSDVCSSDLWRDNLMSWEGLEEVVAIADTGSFVGAANLLSVSTSHVSRVVARLETRLDTKLFDRTTRRVGLTDTGGVFVERCRHLIEEREDLLAELAGSGRSEEHTSELQSLMRNSYAVFCL